MISIYFYFTCQCAPQFSLGYKMLETTLKDNCNFLGFSKSPHLCEGKLVTDRSSVSFLIHIMLHTLHPVIFILFFWFYSELRRFILTIQLYNVPEKSFGVLFGCNFDPFYVLEESELRVHDLRITNDIHIQCCLRIGLVLLRGQAFSHHIYTMRNGGIPKNNRDSVKKKHQFLENIISKKFISSQLLLK